MASPNKIKNVGYNYKPFEMPAKAYNNSPIEKNYGSPVQRGIATPKGLVGGEAGDPEAKTGVGSSLLYAATGSSPAKGFWDTIKKVGRKAIDPLDIFKKKKAKEAAVTPEATGGGDGSHTHGADGGVVAGGAPAEKMWGGIGAVADTAVAGPAAPAEVTATDPTEEVAV